MGSSSWNDDFYKDRVSERASTGTPVFDYHAKVSATIPRADWKVHDKLNPHNVTRESRDSKEHPNSVAIAVLFDVTGSMATVPGILQAKLPQLMGLILRKGYCEDPQILFGAIGDATCDKVSLQIGQFESGIEMDEDMGRFMLEGGGGPSDQESYQNAIYFMARHTSIDCFEKRGHKGLIFIIGDERPYSKISTKEVETLIGDTLQSDLSTDKLVKELQEKYHVFFLIPREASNASSPEMKAAWEGLLGPQNVLWLENASQVAETVALTVGLLEGTVDFEHSEEALKEAGVDPKTAHAVSKSLAAKGKELVKMGSGSLPAKSESSKAIERL